MNFARFPRQGFGRCKLSWEFGGIRDGLLAVPLHSSRPRTGRLPTILGSGIGHKFKRSKHEAWPSSPCWCSSIRGQFLRTSLTRAFDSWPALLHPRNR